MIITRGGKYMLSDAEEHRVKEILEELKRIFSAESVGMYPKRQSIKGCDMCIDIYNSPFGSDVSEVTGW